MFLPPGAAPVGFCNECWLCVNEVLPLDRTSGDLVSREAEGQCNIHSRLATAHPSTDCPCVEPGVVWLELSSDLAYGCH